MMKAKKMLDEDIVINFSWFLRNLNLNVLFQGSYYNETVEKHVVDLAVLSKMTQSLI